METEVILQKDISSIKERAKEKLRRDMGPFMETALNDPLTVEIMLNADGKLWQERLREKMCCIGTMTPARAEALIKTVAGFHDKEVTKRKPTIEGIFPLDGSRFAGQLPPVVSSLLFLVAHPAFAASTKGGGLPFDSWYTTVLESITGPYVYITSIAGIVGAGAGLIFGGDMNGFLRTLIFIVLVLSFTVAAKNTLSAITGQGAEITSFIHHHYVKAH
jgi:type IV secretory pathway VirB2 component (pilin)